MKEKNTSAMPPEYEYLNAPLFRAQEQVFLINKEIERSEGNPLNEQRLVKLDDEKNGIIQGLKREFEMQAWEEGPGRSQEIEEVIDKHLGDEAYQAAKEKLAGSVKTYETSNYWQDRYNRNIAAMHEQYGVYENPSDFKDLDQLGRFDEYDDLDKD